MNPGPSRFRRAVTVLTALAILGSLYFLSQLPTLPSAEAETIAARFRFEKLPFPEMAGYRYKSVREVHPTIAHMAAWMSTLGASAALGDIDGDGLPNDLCFVDPRIDQVVVAPAPGTDKERYAPFVLKPGSLPYDNTMAPMGCLLGDFNEDGLTDVLVYFWGRSPIIYLQQPSSKSATTHTLSAQSFVPCELINPCQRWSSNAATLADLDGDGHYDLIIGNYGPDYTRPFDPSGYYEAGDCPIQMQHSMSRAFNGGGPHFFLWKPPNDPKKTPVSFELVDPELIGLNKTQEHEACHGWTLAMGCADLDGDGLPEIYVSNDFGPDRLFHNRSQPGKLSFALLEGERTFTTPRSKVLGRDSFKGMGIDFGDVNGDGLLDMFVSNLSGPFSIFESHFLWLSTGQVERMKQGVAPYYDAGEPLGLSRSGWAWDSRLADFDNDGVLEAVQAHGFMKGTVNRWPEIQELAAANDQLLSTPLFWPDLGPGADLSGHDHNRFYVRASDGRFYDFSKKLGLGDPMVTRGIALADVDGDGGLDFAVANMWEPSFLYHNIGPKRGAYLGLHLRLPIGSPNNNKTLVKAGHPGADRDGRPRKDPPSRPAIGAAVTVHLPEGRADGKRILVAQVDGGSGHSGKRAPDIHLGLGDVEKEKKLQVDVRWRGPDGKLRSQTLSLTPGWHTVWLGLDASYAEVANHE